MIKDDISLIIDHINHILSEIDEIIATLPPNDKKYMWYLGQEVSLEELKEWINKEI